MNMKINFLFFYLGLILLALSACDNEKLEMPEPKFEIQSYNKIKNIWESMDKPYTIVLSSKNAIRVISSNSSEYNSFYMGDSVSSGKIFIKHIYRLQPHKDYQGLSLIVDKVMKRGLAEIVYPKAGNFKVTFVSTNIGVSNNKQLTAIAEDSIFVKN